MSFVSFPCYINTNILQVYYQVWIYWYSIPAIIVAATTPKENCTVQSSVITVRMSVYISISRSRRFFDRWWWPSPSSRSSLLWRLSRRTTSPSVFFAISVSIFSRLAFPFFRSASSSVRRSATSVSRWGTPSGFIPVVVTRFGIVQRHQWRHGLGILEFALFFRIIHIFDIVVYQGTDAWFQLIVVFKDVPFLNAREDCVENSFFVEQLVDEFIHVNQFEIPLPIEPFQFPVVEIEWLEIFVTVERRASQAHVNCPECTNIFEILLGNEFYNNVFFRLDLQHFQDEA